MNPTSDEVARLNALLSADKEYHFKPEVVPKKRVVFSNVRSLAAVEKYVWYTPALVYLWGRFSDTPLTDIVQRVGSPVLWYRFDKPFFEGLEAGQDTSWNHILWGCPRESWDKFVDAVLETAQFDLSRRILYTYALQETQIYDPLTVDRDRLFVPDRTPRIKVGVFAVCTNKFQIAMSPNAQLHKPKPIRLEPDKTVKRLALQFFATGNLTEENAFGRYKQFLLQANDAEFETLKAQFLRDMRRKRGQA